MPGKSYGTWQATVCVCVCVCVLVAHSCLTLCDPIDCRPPGSSVHGIYIYIYSCCCLVAKSCVILLQPHGLANPLDRGAWGAIVHETAKSWTQLNTHTHTHTHTHFPDSSAGKKSTCNAADPSSIPGLGRSPGKAIGYSLQYSLTSLVSQMVKNLPAMWETQVQSLGWEDPLEKEIATYSSFLFLPEEFHGQRSLEDYSLWGRKESDTTEQLTHTHIHTPTQTVACHVP